MTMRVHVRSRRGNALLASVGAIYAVAAAAVLAWLVFDVWGAMTFTELLLQAAMLGSAACGVWFVYIALQNLRGRQRSGNVNAASIQR